MDWKSLLVSALLQIPGTVINVENIMHGQPGVDKKQKALEIAMQGLKVTDALLPAHADKINAVAGEVGKAIDAAVNIFHIAGVFQKKPAAAASGG